MNVQVTSLGTVDLDRFWGRVDKETQSGCWLWTGQTTPRGYGVFAVNRRSKRAHRVAYVLCVGDIADGLTLDHLCRVRNCVNPAHLEPVTAGENVRRGQSFTARNYRKTHCDHGHEFSEENTAITPEGYRECRVCRRQISQRYRARKRVAA